MNSEEMKEKGKIANMKNRRSNPLKSKKSAKIDRLAKKLPTHFDQFPLEKFL